MFEPTITLSVAQVLAVLLATVTLIVMIVVSLRPAKRNIHLHIKKEELRDLVNGVFTEFMANVNERFEPVMKAYEQCKKDNEEMREALKSRQVGVAKLAKNGQLVASIGYKAEPYNSKKHGKVSDLMEVSAVQKKKKRTRNNSPEAKAKRAEQMRKYRARVKKSKV